jgi:hypothetical protein
MLATMQVTVIGISFYSAALHEDLSAAVTGSK